MSDLGLVAWLFVGAALMASGWLAAAARRDRGGLLTGTFLLLAGAVLDLAAFVRHAVLPAASLSTAVVVLVLGALLVLLGEVMATPKDDS